MRDYSNSGESTSVSCHQIEDDLQTQGMTVSCTSALTQQLASSVKNSKKGSYVVREIHEDSTDWHKKARLQFARTCQNTYGRMSWGQMGKRTISIFTENKIKPSNKRTPSLQLNMEVVQWCFVIVCCLCHWVPSMCQGLNVCAGFLREYLYIPTGFALISREIPTSLSAWKTIGTVRWWNVSFTRVFKSYQF